MEPGIRWNFKKTKFKTMKLNRFVISLIISFCSSLILFGQTDTTSNRIILTGKNTGEKVILRWVPSSPGVWSTSNDKGYMVERLAFRDSIDFFESGYQLLTPDTLKPWPLDDWEPIANAASGDQYAAIAAQALYGDRNALTKKDSEIPLIQKAHEYENLFASAILAAEYSAPAAIASALRYEDFDIDTNYTYMYMVYSLASTQEYPIDTAHFVVVGRDVDKPAQVVWDGVREMEGAVHLQWDRELHRRAFSGYYIERSQDRGQNWIALNQVPYIDSPTDNVGVPSPMMTYIDSVEANYINYYYRIIGINTYGELSQPSEPIQAMGRDRTAPTAPYNIEANQVMEGQMEISWQSDDPTTAGFYISRKTRLDDEQVLLTPEMLGPQVRTYTDTNYNPLMSQWYMVVAFDTAGNGAAGLPQYGKSIDSIPPAIPQGLSGTIDTNGVVTVTWTSNSEPDLIGYKVHYSNATDHVYAGLHVDPITDTFFIDTINIKVLTEDIYYKIVSVDHSKNHSPFSEVLKLTKPDLLPPTSPVIQTYKVNEDGIYLKWANSTSHDVVDNILMRRLQGAEDWEELVRVGTQQPYAEFLDKTTEAGIIYEYRVRALDDADLWSPTAFPVSLKSVDYSRIPPPENLEVSLREKSSGIEIKWDYSSAKGIEFVLYRAVNGGGFLPIVKLEAPDKQFVDTRTRKGQTYEYNVMAVRSSDGKKSVVSNTQKVVSP